MPTLPLLADTSTYRPCRHNLRHSSSDAAYWLSLFRVHFPKTIAEAKKQALHESSYTPALQKNFDACQAQFLSYIDDLQHNRPTPFDDLSKCDTSKNLDILTICEVREHILRQAGIADPYLLAKTTENESSLALLPALLDQLDNAPAHELVYLIAQGVFAGNIYDLGATKTAALFEDGKVHFHDIRAKLKSRPWLIDTFKAWTGRLAVTPHKHALLFVDNAGPDVLLGMLPFARFLLARGTKVTITSNTSPALNDITHPELMAILPRIFAFDKPLADAWSSGALCAVTSGCATPLIDLTRISRELVAHIHKYPVDLVVLEGMGRAIESNFDARFTCESIKTAMIKDPGVAKTVHGEMYDLVFKYEG
jgi:damage-control phosphatase, subfamily II, stand-alone protein